MEAVPSTRTQPMTEDHRGGQSCGPGEMLLQQCSSGREEATASQDTSCHCSVVPLLWLGWGGCWHFGWRSRKYLGFTNDNVLDLKVSTSL